MIKPWRLVPRLLRDLAGPLHRRRSRSPLQAIAAAVPRGDIAWRDAPQWAQGGAAPTDGNLVTPLVDGRNAMLEIYRAIAQAQHSVYIADWFLTADMELVRGTDQQELRGLADKNGGSFVLKDLLGAVARRADVRVLVWSGSRFFQPSGNAVQRVLKAIAAVGSEVLARIDPTGSLTHCHHQKLVIVDERVAVLGGIDLTNLEIDRWDQQRHPVRHGQNWHDVDIRLEGPAVADLVRGFRDRWPGEWSKEPRPPSPPLPTLRYEHGLPVQILRTHPAGRYHAAPKGEYSNFEALWRVIQNAERFLYIENQYLWSPDVTDALAEAIRRPRSQPFQVTLLLPSHPNIGKPDSNYHIRRLMAADGGRGVFHVYSLYTSGALPGERGLRYHPVYIHAKVLIADDEWTIVASANLNGRSMAGDTEIGALVQGASCARDLRLRLWSEHLGFAAELLADRDPCEALRTLWPARAKEAEQVLAARTKLLESHVVPYRFGLDVGDLEMGWAEAMVLDR